MNFLNQNYGSSLNMCTSCKYIDVDDVSRSSKKCSRCGSELSSSDGNNIFPPYSIAKYISMLKKFIKDSEHESEKAEKEVVESVQDHLLGQNSNISDKKILETINGTQKIYFSNKVNSATRAIENFNSRLGCSIDGDFLLNNIIFFNGKSDYNAMIPVFASLIAETYLYNATKCFSEIIGKPKKYNDRLDIKEYYKIFTEEGEDLKKILNDLDCKCGEDILKISNVRNNVMHGRTIQVSGEVVEKAKNFPDRLLPIYAKLQNYLIEKYSSNI